MAVYSMPANTLVGATYFTPDLVKYVLLVSLFSLLLINIGQDPFRIFQ